MKLIEAFVPLETDRVAGNVWSTQDQSRRNLANVESTPERQLFKLVPASQVGKSQDGGTSPRDRLAVKFRINFLWIHSQGRGLEGYLLWGRGQSKATFGAPVSVGVKKPSAWVQLCVLDICATQNIHQSVVISRHNSSPVCGLKLDDERIIHGKPTPAW